MTRAELESLPEVMDVALMHVMQEHGAKYTEGQLRDAAMRMELAIAAALGRKATTVHQVEGRSPEYVRPLSRRSRIPDLRSLGSMNLKIVPRVGKENQRGPY